MHKTLNFEKNKSVFDSKKIIKFAEFDQAYIFRNIS